MIAVRIGSLCSGYGGLDMAAEQLTGGKVAWVSDIDKGACKILAHRYPDVANLGDFTKTDWADVEPIYMLTAGYPCQPFSHAGKRAGTEDARHLWPEVLRCLTSLRPPFALFENVRGHLSLGFDQVLADLATHEYDARWIVLRAADIGAPHGRARLFILAADARRSGDRWNLVGAGRGTVRVGGVRGQDPDAGGNEGRADLLGGMTLLPTPRVTQPGYANDGRGGKSLDVEARLLPTPTSSDTNGAGSHGDGGADLRTTVSLLPTPTARDGKDGQIRREPHRPDDVDTLSRALTVLLPTPLTTDWKYGTSPGAMRRKTVALGSVDALVPDAKAGAWGDYAPAIHRWAHVLGRPAPAPTMLSAKGNPQLSPRFVEWMMGLVEGWVDDVPNMSRNEKLKALGNGVVTQQAVEGVRRLLVLEVAA